MMREVRTPEGRTWMIRREINWSKPVNAREFEHDVAASGISGIVMLVVVVLMFVTVLWWTPAGVVIPGWLGWVFFAVLMLLPAQWATSRPWTIEASTHHPQDNSWEQWTGTVRGMRASRGEVSRVARHLARHETPDDRGPLQKVY